MKYSARASFFQPRTKADSVFSSWGRRRSSQGCWQLQSSETHPLEAAQPSREPLSPPSFQRRRNVSHGGQIPPSQESQGQCRPFLNTGTQQEFRHWKEMKPKPKVVWKIWLFIISYNPSAINIWWCLKFKHCKIFFQTGNPWVLSIYLEHLLLILMGLCLG